jgi:hypothetical protein
MVQLARPLLVGTLGVLTALLLGWLIVLGTIRWTGSQDARSPATSPASPAAPSAQDGERRIRAKLFYVASDGMRLVPVDREVPFAETTVEQARRLIEAQLASPPERYVSPIPAGTKLRQVYLTDRREAYVDLTGELVNAHPGGSLNELFTVYALVNVLTVNLPAVTAVQILVDGKQVDTIAGHVDVRRPLRPGNTE